MARYVFNDRYCDPCSDDLDSSTLPCELCSFKGGAYKPAIGQNKWVHSVCYLWNPESFTNDIGMGKLAIDITAVDKKRFKLHCNICDNIDGATGAVGACVQCSYGKCLIAAHPWCASHFGIQRGYGIDLDIENKSFRMFCSKHSHCMPDEDSSPLRKKPSAEAVEKSRIRGTKRTRLDFDTASISSNDQVTNEYPLSTSTPIDASLLGQSIARYFPGHGTLQGYVTSYDAPYYLIEYPVDGDKEEMTRGQVMKHLLERTDLLVSNQ